MAALFPQGPLICPVECNAAVDSYSSLVNDPKACRPTTSNLARVNAKNSSCIAQQRTLIDSGYTTCVVALPCEASVCGFSSQDAFNNYCATENNVAPCCFSQMVTIPFVGKAAVYPSAVMGSNASSLRPTNNNSYVWSNPIILAGIAVGAVVILGAMGFLTARVARSSFSKLPSINVTKQTSVKKGTPSTSPLSTMTADLECKATITTTTPPCRHGSSKVSPAGTVTILSSVATLLRAGTGPPNSPKPTIQLSPQNTQPRPHIFVSRRATVDQSDRINTGRSNRSNHQPASLTKSIQISVRNNSIPDIAHNASQILPKGNSDTPHSQGVRVRVVHPYVASMRDEISITPGHEVIVLKRYEDGWGLGRDLSTMQYGAFPLVCVVDVSQEDGACVSVVSVATNLPDSEACLRSNFVAEMEEEEWAGLQGKRIRANSGVSSLYSVYGRSCHPPSPVPGSGKTEAEGGLHLVLYSYDAMQKDELDLAAGESVLVVQEFDDGWALGENLVTGQRGAVPMACLTSILHAEPGTENQLDSFVSHDRLSKRVSSFG
ncbi:hypothetical protein BC830DRAFT_1089452 [Chytriomyces sp. MP71]|nr:hypothetical protein BC830DRAFT_1089452 [Chytriomyces sp. MP71]